jgi:DNA-binding LacI/PurR family transcriptional regulator
MSNASQILAETSTTRLPSDAAEVAARVGVSSSLVRKVINGSRTNEKVLKAYHLLLNERARAQQKFQSDKKGA